METSAVDSREEFDVENPVERLMASNDGRLAFQDEESISLLNAKTGEPAPVLADRRGRELVGLLDGKRIVTFHDEGGLVGFEDSGRRFAGTAISGDREFADARVLRDGRTVVVLLAEMVGPEMGLAVPRYRFVVADSRLSIAEVDGEWPAWPRVWAVDEAMGRLLVASAVGNNVVTEFDLKTGKQVAESRWPASETNELILTGFGFSPADGQAAVGLCDAQGQQGQLCVIEKRGGDSVTVATVSDPGPVSRITWSSDGARVLFLSGDEANPTVMVAKIGSGSTKAQPKTLCRIDADADAAWCHAKRVAVVDEATVRILDA